jgi:hypothetical protein
MRDIQLVLERWGGWAVRDNSYIDYPSIASGFKGLLILGNTIRPSCTDDDGLIIDSCIAKLKEKRPHEYELLVDYYLFGISKRKIAKKRKKDEKIIRIEIKMAEGFIEGCLAMLQVDLDMD